MVFVWKNPILPEVLGAAPAEDGDTIAVGMSTQSLPVERVNNVMYEHRGLASPVAVLISRKMAKGGTPCPHDVYTATIRRRISLK